MPKDWTDTKDTPEVKNRETDSGSSKTLEQAVRGPADPAETTYATGESDWVERGVMDVPVADLPWPEGIDGPDDFDHHISYDDAVKVTKRLEEMKPLIRQGHDSEDFAEMDRAAGRDYEHGNQRIYDLYYGSQAIRVDKDADDYCIVNGRHRIYVAKTLGLSDIPASVTERIRR